MAIFNSFEDLAKEWKDQNKGKEEEEEKNLENENNKIKFKLELSSNLENTENITISDIKKYLIKFIIEHLENVPIITEKIDGNEMFEFFVFKNLSVNVKNIKIFGVDER